MRNDWSIEGEKDPQVVRSDWSDASSAAIDGVVAKQITNVLTDNGCLTEIWRSDWKLDDRAIDQVFQRVIEPGKASGWHSHARTTDRLFCAIGRLLVALYDGRRSSPTFGAVATFRLGAERPAVIVVPPGVWHGVRNIGTSSLVLLNIVDIAYDYEDPDHYRVPLDTPLIPFSL